MVYSGAGRFWCSNRRGGVKGLWFKLALFVFAVYASQIYFPVSLAGLLSEASDFLPPPTGLYHGYYMSAGLRRGYHTGLAFSCLHHVC